MGKLHTIPQGRCQVGEFADDDTFYKQSKDPSLALLDLKNTMEDVLKFLDTSGLEASQDKYQLCIFSRDPKVISKVWSLRIGDIVVKSKTVFKLLGLQFQNTLNWDIHIENIRVR